MPGFFIGSGASGSVSATLEFHRTHRWAIQSLGAPSAVTGGGSTTSATADRGSQPFLFAKSLKLPSLQFDEELIQGGSSPYSFAKVAVWQACEISFYDVFGLYALLKQWRDTIWSASAGMNVADNYKGQPIINLLDNDGNTTYSFKLVGAWPQHVHHGELNYTSSEIKLLTVTFKYDYAQDDQSTSTVGR